MSSSRTRTGDVLAFFMNRDGHAPEGRRATGRLELTVLRCSACEHEFYLTNTSQGLELVDYTDARNGSSCPRALLCQEIITKDIIQ